MQDDLTLLLTLDVQAVGQDALQGVAAGLQAIATQAGLTLQEATPLGDAFAPLLEAAAGLGAALAAGLAGIDWQAAGTTLANGLRGAWDTAVDTFQAGGAAELTALVAAALGNIDWTVAGAALGGFAPLLERALLEPAEQSLAQVGAAIGNTLDQLGQRAGAAAGTLASAVVGALESLGRQTLAALGEAAAAIAATGAGQLAAAGAAVLGALDQVLGNFVPEAVARGAQIVGGLWQGIDSLAGWLATELPVWLTTNLLTPVRTLFGIGENGGSAGGSAVMAGIGADLVHGLMDGMTDLAGALLAAADALVAPLPAALLGFQADFSAVGAGLMESMRGGIVAKAGEIADQARAVVQGAIDAARSVLSGIEGSIGAAQATLAGLNSGTPVGHNAGGTDSWRGGLTWVGEDGPELVNLPRGAQVIPLSGPAVLPPGLVGNANAINVYVSGNTVLSDREADLLASRVGQAIVRQTGLAYSLVR